MLEMAKMKKTLPRVRLIVLSAVVMCALGLVVHYYRKGSQEPPGAGDGAEVPDVTKKGSPAQAPPMPNVILIMVETLRADHVGALGYGRGTTKRIDELARAGAICTNAYSTSSWTPPAVMSVFTGLYPSSHGVIDTETSLGDGVGTIAGHLKRLGYSVLGVVSTPCLDGRLGFSRGFDLYDDFSVFSELRVGLFDSEAGGEELLHRVPTAQIVNRVALQLLRREEDYVPFFLFVQYFDPHYDYAPPPPYDSLFDTDYTGKANGLDIFSGLNVRPGMPEGDLEHVVALYDGEIAFTDAHIGELLDEMEAMGKLDNALIVLFGDHGEEFLEHGGCAHGRTLYEEVVRVPVLFNFSGEVAEGGRVDGPVSLADLMPTILELIGEGAPEGLDGRSLAPYLGGGGPPQDRAVLFELDYQGRKLAGFREGEWKLILDLADGEGELFSLDGDPGERHNMKAAQPALLRRGGGRLLEWLARNNASKGTPAEGAAGRRADLDEEALQRLRGLGYVSE